MIRRAVVVLILVGAVGLWTTRAGTTEVAVTREPLSELPMQVAGWEGRTAAPFADDVVAQLGVDDYINRLYAQGNAPPIALYVGYYASQRQGDTIHSPQNCLPGAGWQPVEAGRTELQTPDGPVAVNRYVIQKGIERQVVLYWYQGRGRIVANEYANKAYLMLDAATSQRTSGGLVRLITPVAGSVADASSRLSAFAEALLPHLARHLP